MPPKIFIVPWRHQCQLCTNRFCVILCFCVYFVLASTHFVRQGVVMCRCRIHKWKCELLRQSDWMVHRFRKMTCSVWLGVRVCVVWGRFAPCPFVLFVQSDVWWMSAFCGVCLVSLPAMIFSTDPRRNIRNLGAEPFFVSLFCRRHFFREVGKNKQQKKHNLPTKVNQHH